MIPTILIILTIHIIIAIRWMLIKILSAVINDWERIKVIVPGGCYLDILQSSIYTTLAHYFYAFIGITEECIYKGFIVIKSRLIMISI